MENGFALQHFLARGTLAHVGLDLVPWHLLSYSAQRKSGENR